MTQPSRQTNPQPAAHAQPPASPVPPTASQSSDASRYSRDSGRYVHDERSVEDGRAPDAPAAQGAPAQASSSYVGAHAAQAGRAPANAPKLRLTAEELYPALAKSRRRGRIAKRVAVIALAVLLVFGGALGGLAWWYTDKLDHALAFSDAEETKELDLSLVEPASGEPYYVLVLGSDSREGSGTSAKADEQGDNERSDVMILVRVDPDERLLTLVTIPRDTPVRTDDGGLMKINEAYNQGGAAYSVHAVSELTGVDIAHVAEVRFSELQDLVDKLGGVTVDVNTELSYYDALTGEWITIEPGEQTLDGQEAQIFARARHEYETDQDMHRQNNVRELATAIVKTAISKPLFDMPGVVLDVAECVNTDMVTPEILGLMMAFGADVDGMTVYSTTGPSDGDFNPEADGLWLCYENPEGWAAIMEVVNAGEDPTGIDVSATAVIPASEETPISD